MDAATQVKFGQIDVQVVRKDVKHVRLRILEPSFEVRLSIPRHMPLELAHALAMTKQEWLTNRLEVLRSQYAGLNALTEAVADTRLIWGERVKLTVTPSASKNWVGLRDGALFVESSAVLLSSQVNAVIDRWYRSELQSALVLLVEKWEQRMQTKAGTVVIQRMKTRWGTCNSATRRIRLNMDLVKKPAHLLEYVLVHEMVHFFHNNHGSGFKSAMDGYLPNWRELRNELNCFPRL